MKPINYLTLIVGTSTLLSLVIYYLDGLSWFYKQLDALTTSIPITKTSLGFLWTLLVLSLGLGNFLLLKNKSKQIVAGLRKFPMYSPITPIFVISLTIVFLRLIYGNFLVNYDLLILTYRIQPYILIFLLLQLALLALVLITKGLNNTGASKLPQFQIFKPKNDGDGPQKLGFPDEPIEKDESDILNRVEFVDLFYNEIEHLPHDDSFVFALQGKWGEGKTSVLNLLKNRLNNNSEYIVIEFNPWLFDNAKDLMTAFFKEFIKALDSNIMFSPFRNTWKDYAKTLGVIISNKIPILSTFLNIITKENSLTQSKRMISNTLRQMGKKIVIIMDDIDRIDTEELYEVLKLVKLVSNFPNTRFVLALEHELVEGVLTQKRKQIGDRFFLEKIIQKILQLPKADQNDIDTFLYPKLEGLLEVGIEESEKNRIMEEYRSFHLEKLRGVFNTLRKAKRYLNSLVATLSSQKQKGEIDLLDVILLEIIRIFYPKVFEDIWTNRSYYFYYEWESEALAESPLKYSFKEDENNEEIKGHIENIIKSYSKEEQNTILDVLIKVFLPVDRAFNRPNYSFIGYNSLYRANRRITHPLIFRRYFLPTKRLTIITDGEVRKFIKSLASKKTNKVGDTLLEKVNRYKERGLATEFLNLLDIHHKEFSSELIGLVIPVFASIADDEYKDPNPWDNPVAEQAFVLIFRLLDEFPDATNIQEQFEKIIKNNSKFVATRAIKWVTSGQSTFYNIKRSTDIQKLSIKLHEELKNYYIKRDRDIFALEKQVAGFILRQWANLGDLQKNTVRNYANKLIEKKLSYAIRIITGFGVFWSEDDVKIEYDLLESIYDSDTLYKAVEKVKKDSLEDKKQDAIVAVFKKVYEGKNRKKRRENNLAPSSNNA